MAIAITTTPQELSHGHHPVKAESGTDTMKLVDHPQDLHDAKNRMTHTTNNDADTPAASNDRRTPGDA